MQWISIEDQYPENNEIVLVCDRLNSFASLAKFIDRDDEYVFELMYVEPIEIDSVITHWMPLPSPPQNE